MGQYIFYSDNGGGGNKLGSIDSSGGQSYNLKDSEPPIQNDEARSVVLQGVDAGSILIVSDSPNGCMDDDWCVIEVLQNIDNYTVPSFEQPINEQWLRLTYFKFNGLDGKVSHLATA